MRRAAVEDQPVFNAGLLAWAQLETQFGAKLEIASGSAVVARSEVADGRVPKGNHVPALPRQSVGDGGSWAGRSQQHNGSNRQCHADEHCTP